MAVVYLSRRNLLALLSKLDRVATGDFSNRTLIKHDSQHPIYPQSEPSITVIAVEDSDYYIDREPGEILPADVHKHVYNYIMCAVHEGMPFKFFVQSAPIIAAVCPICYPPAAEENATSFS